jgi:CRISPR-associated protein Cas1
VSKKGEELGDVRLIDVSQVCLFGNVQLSSQLLRELMAREVPVAWFSTGGWFQGLATGMPAGNVELRCRQFGRAQTDSLPIARRMIEGKIRNSRTLLRRNSRETNRPALDSLTSLANAAANADSIGSLLGHEGTAARIFFARFPDLLRPPDHLPGDAFSFEGRRRRPPPDAVNCLLSYCYSLLTKDCAATLFTVGFDPLLGFLHRPRFGRPALALDLAEEFRPLIAESTVITVINNGEVSPTDFVVRARGVMLTQGGRRAVLHAYERRLGSEVTHPLFGYRVTYRRALEVQARLLGALLMREIDEYTPFTTR